MIAENVFELASGFIHYTNCAVFLTGKAGTGKTTFLKYCKENVLKNTVVVAPTGVAAMNAGGTTIHSFFQLPFAPFIPVQTIPPTDNSVHYQHTPGRLRITNERREVMRQLELLIIDEISMVRCDVLDAIDAVLRQVRKKYTEPFGGVQVLLIGDLYQLPPVVNEAEWKILSAHYKSRYFFSSRILKNYPPVYLELDKVYRQADASFVALLNKIRNNELDEESLSVLHGRYQPRFYPPKSDNFITLTTHNSRADAINLTALAELTGRLSCFNAAIEGEFHEKSYPAELQLKLKTGAQVMFVKNDSEKNRRFFNGRIGTVIKIEAETIQVMCKGDTEPIEVKKEKWKNILYAFNKATRQVEENTIGAFTQFPLRLAWAITIHKSQGLTFDKAIIDAGEAFTPGQVYVALSRCTSLEGIVLHSCIQNNSLRSDPIIDAFIKSQVAALPATELLQQKKKSFQQAEIINAFDLKDLLLKVKRLFLFVQEHQPSFENIAIKQVALLDELLRSVEHTSGKFITHLQVLLIQPGLPENNSLLQSRLKAATQHFIPQLENIQLQIPQGPVMTNSKMLAAEFAGLLRSFSTKLAAKIHMIGYFQQDFDFACFLKYKKAFVEPGKILSPGSEQFPVAKSILDNQLLYEKLKQKRAALCKEKNCPEYSIASNRSLEEMTLYLPQTFDELMQIDGFGKIKSNRYGDVFLQIIRDYCILHKLQSNMAAKAVIKTNENAAAKKFNTRVTTLQLFKAGKTIDEIAELRKLSVGTIESHLTHLAATGEIDLNKLISKEKQELIRSVIQQFGKASVKTLKENLPGGIKYGEIRMMLSLT